MQRRGYGAAGKRGQIWEARESQNLAQLKPGKTL
jgi:hypothetical protein